MNKNNNIKLHLKSISKESLKLFSSYLQENLKKLQTNYSFFSLPQKNKRITLFKSPHVNKKAKEQFELKYYKNIFVIKLSNQSENQKLKYLLINKPKSVELKIKL